MTLLSARYRDNGVTPDSCRVSHIRKIARCHRSKTFEILISLQSSSFLDSPSRGLFPAFHAEIHAVICGRWREFKYDGFRGEKNHKNNADLLHVNAFGTSAVCQSATFAFAGVSFSIRPREMD